MIRGAVSGGNRLAGQYSPEEFGRMTVWQMKNVFGYNGGADTPIDFAKNVGAFDTEGAFWKANRAKGESEFTIWQRWNDEVLKPLEELRKKNA